MGNPVIHLEIGCKDDDKTKAFYSELFNWNITQEGPAAMVNTIGLWKAMT